MSGRLVIQAVTNYEVDGKTFTNKDKAIGHVKTMVANQVVQMLINTNYANVIDINRVTEYMWQNRLKLAGLLNFDIDDGD